MACILHILDHVNGEKYMKNLIKKEILVLLIILTFILLSGCTINRDIPPQDVFDELGVEDYIVVRGLTLGETKGLLDKYGFENNYEESVSDTLVYIAKSQDDNKYYCVFVPRNSKYDVEIIAIPLVDFSVIEKKITDYNSSEDSVYKIIPCLNYCDIFFTSFYDEDRYENNDFIDELSYPVIIKIGYLLSDGGGSVSIGIYETGKIVVFTPDSEGSLDILFTIEL